MNFNSSIIQVIWDEKKIHQSQDFKDKALEILEHFAVGFDKHDPIRDIELHFNPVKNPAMKVKFYEIKLIVQLKNGQLLIVNVQDRDILFGLRKAVAKVKREGERSDRQKHENYRKYFTKL